MGRQAAGVQDLILVLKVDHHPITIRDPDDTITLECLYHTLRRCLGKLRKLQRSHTNLYKRSKHTLLLQEIAWQGSTSPREPYLPNANC